MATKLKPIEAAAGWISIATGEKLRDICKRESVSIEVVCARFDVPSLYELQTEDLFDVLVFIGKNSKEN